MFIEQSHDEIYGCLKGGSGNSRGRRLAISMVEEAWLSEKKETRGDDEVELTDEESSDSDNDDEVAEIYRTETNVFDFETPTNLPGAYIVGNTLHYQDLEWYEALEDGKLKDEALKNKAIMEGMIDEDDESHNEGWRRWDGYENTILNHEEMRE
ncbi:hypothetical protein Tco_0167110 [Tanacetum coccineum]